MICLNNIYFVRYVSVNAPIIWALMSAYTKTTFVHTFSDITVNKYHLIQNYGSNIRYSVALLGVI